MNALIDTGLLLDYLRGEKRAAGAMQACAHRSISVITWLELMASCPQGLEEPTRGFLRSFERLSVSESIADEALRLMADRRGLSLPHAIIWASANTNQLMYVTTDPRWVTKADSNVLVPYRRALTQAV
jgi:predicted nucleic acid-binding protein